MTKLKLLAISAAGVGIISASAFGIASAATSSNTNVGNSGIPRTTFSQDRLQAVASVLNTTTANVRSALKNRTLKQLVQNAGLTRKTFLEKVKAQLTTELEGQGYSQAQITLALQHRLILKLRHHLNELKS